MASGTPIQTNLAIGILAQTGTNVERIAVITVEPAGKTSLIHPVRFRHSYTDYLHSCTDCKRHLHSSTDSNARSYCRIRTRLLRTLY